MRPVILLVLLPVMAGMVHGQEPVPPLDPRAGEAAKPTTESRSRQFLVHGSNLQVRNAVATLADETRQALVDVVGGGDGFKNPIVIELRGRPGTKVPPNPMAVSVYTVNGGFRLQLDIHLARGIDREALERRIIELLIFERSLRNRSADGFEDRLLVPDWLLEGFLEKFRWRRQEGDRNLYAALFKRKALFSVERLLPERAARDLGAGERAAFRASSGALVMALLDQPDGKEGMAGFLSEVATFEGQPMAILMKHFPDMNLGENSLEKWWALQLARMAEAPVTEMMTVAETEAALDEALVIRFDDGQGGSIGLEPAQFRDVLALDPERRLAAVGPVADRLTLMSFRAFPGHRPVIAGYLAILGELVQDRDENLDARLTELDQSRDYLRRIGVRTRDILEWYHITTAVEVSGAFDDYLKLKEKLQQGPSQRRGPISAYLDAIEKVYERP